MKYVAGTEIAANGDMATAVIRLTERMEVLSNAILNGGITETDTLFIMQVPHRVPLTDPWAQIRAERDRLGLPQDAVGLMTAAEVGYVFTTQSTDHEGSETFAAVTAGLSNHVVAGETIADWDERSRISMERYRALIGGTINIIGISPVPLTLEGKVNLMMPIVEAKSAALADTGFRETGTTSDAVAVVSPAGDAREAFSGTGTPLGISMARSVRAGVAASLDKRGDRPVPGTFVDALARAGIPRDSLWEAASELYDPNPAWDAADVRRRFEERIDVLCEDINISSMIQAALVLDEMGGKGCICALPREMFATDPIHLIADEMIGIQIAEYIAGTRGLFEFSRFDRHKPGIIGRAGPFTDDMLCGLVGGTMSAVYTDLFYEEISGVDMDV